MTKIKICGINDEAGLNAVMAGNADFFGIVMAEESPRYVDMALAKHLLAMADTHKIKSILLLVNPALDEATYLTKELNPYGLQLHGGESPDLCQAIKNQTGKKIIKALPIEKESDFMNVKDYEEAVDYFLFDAKPNAKPSATSKNNLQHDAKPNAESPVLSQKKIQHDDDKNTASDEKRHEDKHAHRHGGLGRVFDWSLLQHYKGGLPFFLAGGLNPDNIATAMGAVKKITPLFFAIDVSSGVEESLGKKSPSKIKKFCTMASGKKT